MTKGNKGGRPAKINTWRLEAAEKVISDDNNIVCLTDEDLLDEINDNIEPEHQISHTTFVEYKGGKKLEDKKKQALLDRFSFLYKKALRKQKRNLLNKMVKDPDKRQKYAWIIERKFDEWNIRVKTDQRHGGPDGGPIPTDITIKIKRNGDGS